MKFIIFSDVHANSIALLRFIEQISIIEFDKLIFLGDALTYGVNVKETISLLRQLKEKYDCIFIKGNHEQIYFDYQDDKDYQYKKFPEFLLESISDTAAKLDIFLENEFDWIDFFYYKGVVFSHANLFDYGNWSYLNTEKDFNSNYSVITENNLRGAIFGHTHRAKYKRYKNSNIHSALSELTTNIDVYFFLKDGFLVTNGSLGQPRGTDASFLECKVDDDKVYMKSVAVEYNIALHCQSIIESNLTDETKEKLLRYYKEV